MNFRNTLSSNLCAKLLTAKSSYPSIELAGLNMQTMPEHSSRRTIRHLADPSQYEKDHLTI
jgi:hypothetical protein